MQVRNIVLGFVAVSLLAGCGIFDRKQVDYKAGAVQPQPLEVPPDLTVPATEQRYAIPGADGKQVASYSEYSKQPTEQPCVAPAAPVATQSVPLPAVKLQESKGGKHILIGEPFDRSWRRVGLALDRAQIVTTDKDRSKGIYFVAAPAKDKKKQPDYQVIVRGKRQGSEISVVDQNGKSDAETVRLIEVLYQNLGNDNRGDAVRPAR